MKPLTNIILHKHRENQQQRHLDGCHAALYTSLTSTDVGYQFPRASNFVFVLQRTQLRIKTQEINLNRQRLA